MELNEYLKATNGAETLIKNYVLANASNELTEKILKGEKNIPDCFNFIKGEAKKQASNGCACLSDQEVFGLAIHYFEEDSIKPGAKVEAKVKTSTHKNKDGVTEDVDTDVEGNCMEEAEMAKPVVAKPKKDNKLAKKELEAQHIKDVLEGKATDKIEVNVNELGGLFDFL